MNWTCTEAGVRALKVSELWETTYFLQVKGNQDLSYSAKLGGREKKINEFFIVYWTIPCGSFVLKDSETRVSIKCLTFQILQENAPCVLSDKGERQNLWREPFCHLKKSIPNSEVNQAIAMGCH